MRETLNIKNTSTLLSSLGLALLLLLAPCKVRNYIQAELGFPLTEVSSKSKTTLSECFTIEESESAFSFSITSIQSVAALIPNNVNFTLPIINFYEKSTNTNLVQSSSLALIPYYILFQNFRFHL